jgi:5-methylcytosine-specific restriction protein A
MNARRPKTDTYRGSAHERGYTSRWVKARKAYLTINPLCVECQRVGKLTPANVVDHIVPHGGDMALFWDSYGNWQSLCKPCHDRKTAAEDGGFGNKTGAGKIRQGCDADGIPSDSRHHWLGG